MPPPTRHNLGFGRSTSLTLPEFLMWNQPPNSKGDFTLLMTSIQTAVKIIQKYIARAGIHGTIGMAGETNKTGDDQKKLDIISNNAFKFQLAVSERVKVMVSEEEDKAILVDEGSHTTYALAFDPLDGSSNVDANVSVGSVWGIWKLPAPHPSNLEEATEAMLRPGTELVSAGYAMYGCATTLVITTGSTVDGFTLDASIGEFLLTHPNMRMPVTKNIYSTNEGNTKYYEPWLREYLDHIKNKVKKPYAARYVGAMVADVHRTLLYGGIFLYPSDSKSPDGKLRLLYEGAPMAMLMERAGGKAQTGNGRVLEQVPKKIHQKVPVIMGSTGEVDLCLSFKAKAEKKAKL